MTDSPEAMPDVVYHYTSMETLLKINQQKVIRATSISYLNDVSERRYFFEQVTRRLMSDGSAVHLHKDLILEALALGRHDAKVSFLRLPFVASFSAEFDSLPQWRAYCSQGNGVAIGIRTESLLQATAECSDDNDDVYRLPDVTFAAVHYLHPSDPQTVDKLLETALQTAFAWHKQDLEGLRSGLGLVDFVWSSLEEQASLVKHKSFGTEREYRLVASYASSRGLIDFRPSKSTLVPFLGIKIPQPEGFLGRATDAIYRSLDVPVEYRPSFIDRVIVGPTPHADLSVDALSALFMRQQKVVRVVPSMVPYRDTI